MKKILFSSASAVLAIVGLSAFKTTKTTATTYYWLKVIATVPLSDANLVKRTEVGIVTVGDSLYNGTATPLLFATVNTVESDPIFTICAISGDYCLAGFTSTNPISIVTNSHFTHLSVTIISPNKLGQKN